MTTKEPTNLDYGKKLEQEFKDYLKKAGYKATSFSDCIFPIWREAVGDIPYLMSTQKEAKEFVSKVSRVLRRDKTKDNYLRYMSNFFIWLGNENLLCESLITDVAPTIFTHKAKTYLTGRKPNVKKAKPDDVCLKYIPGEGVSLSNVYVVYDTTAKPLVVGIATSEEEARLLVIGSAVIAEVPINKAFNLQFHDLSITKNVISIKVV